MRKDNFSTQKILNGQTVVLVLAAIGLVVIFSRIIMLNDQKHIVFLLLGSGIGLIGLILISDWRRGMYFFLIWLTFEDLSRRYLGNSFVIYFVKDALIAIAYLTFFLSWRRGKEQVFKPPFLIPLIVFFWFGLIQAFNPVSPSVFYGLLGLKLYFYYIPMMFLGYALINSERSLQRFLYFNLIVASVVALIGIIQSIVGTSFLNPQEIDPELVKFQSIVRTSPISEASGYRPTAVFVSTGRFSWYLILMTSLGFGTVTYLFLRKTSRNLIAIVLLLFILVPLAAIMTNSRAAFVYSLGSMFVIGILLFGGASLQHRSKLIRILLVMSGTAISGLLLLLLLFPQELGARQSTYIETLSPWSPASDLSYRGWQYPVNGILKAFDDPFWLTGNGLGTDSLGRQYFESRLNIEKNRAGLESGYGSIIREMGILGLLFWFLWTGSLLSAGWHVVRELRETPFFSIGTAILWFIFLLLFPLTYLFIGAFQNFISNAYLWLLVGILFRLPTLVANKQSQELTKMGGY